MTTPFDKTEVEAFVRHWFALFDQRAPVETFLGMLVDDGLEMFYPPDGKIGAKDQFIPWLATAYQSFPKTQHTPKSIEHLETRADMARLRVVVNWQADQPSDNGKPPEHLNFDADQRWVLRRQNDGAGFLIAACIVEQMTPC